MTAHALWDDYDQARPGKPWLFAIAIERLSFAKISVESFSAARRRNDSLDSVNFNADSFASAAKFMVQLDMADRTSSERAEYRRQHWTGGVARSFSEMESADLAFWLAATPNERIRGVTQLIGEMLAMKGEDGPAPRLQRAVGGVRPRRG
jgi:hypothetical protein